MIERLNFLVAYVGSAAMVAFLAACLSSPRVSAFTCDSSGTQPCELNAILAAGVPEGTELSAAELSAAALGVDTPMPVATAPVASD